MYGWYHRLRQLSVRLRIENDDVTNSCCSLIQLGRYQMHDLFAQPDVAFCGGGFCFIPLFWSTFEIFVDEQYTNRDDRRAGRYNMVRAVETTAKGTEY